MIKIHMLEPPYSLKETRERIMNNKSMQLPHYLMSEIKKELTVMSNGKCAYCESKTDSLYIDNYRPKGVTRNSDGYVSKEHYWWLQYEWDNLLPCCRECNVYKSNRFPVFSTRVAPGTFDHNELVQERPALLHPYYDDPEEFFIYSEDGFIHSNDKRGVITIENLNLNRINLVNQRKKQIDKLNKKWSTYIDSFKNINFNRHATNFYDIIGDIKLGLADKEEFCGLKRYFFRIWMTKYPDVKEFLNLQDTFFNSIDCNLHGITKSSTDSDLKTFYKYEKEIDNYDINKSIDREKYFSKRRQIERIIIKNFRTIKDLDVTLPIGKSNKYTAPWLMLLGENGTGKSTILQGIALALMDKESRSKFVKNASKLLKNGTEEGLISIYLSGNYEPITLRFGKGNKEFFGDNLSTQRVILLGYGSTRLLPLRSSRKKDDFGVLRVDNLFNPLYLLANANRHLCNLEQSEFEEYVSVLKSLLLLENVSISKDSNAKNRIVLVSKSQGEVAFDDLSDGYRTMLALSVDIIMALRHLNWSNDDGEAIVLIDELDAHLHPQWIIQIVTLLRKTFPNIQFIVSSHDPLCLRGLEQNEILVLRRDINNEIFIESELPPQELLEVDKLLKYQFFGLSTTMDPQTNSDFNEYYKLLRVDNPTSEEVEQLRILKKKLITNGFLGRSPREQIMYEVIDEYMAQTQYNPLKNLILMKDETKKKIRNIINSIREEYIEDDSY